MAEKGSREGTAGRREGGASKIEKGRATIDPLTSWPRGYIHDMTFSPLSSSLTDLYWYLETEMNECTHHSRVTWYSRWSKRLTQETFTNKSIWISRLSFFTPCTWKALYIFNTHEYLALWRFAKGWGRRKGTLEVTENTKVSDTSNKKT